MHDDTARTSPGTDPVRRYLGIASRTLAAVHAVPDGPFVRTVPAGTARGIDFYRASGLVRALADAVARYEHSHRRLPDLVSPASMTEKLLWSKFFTPIPMPSPGDKLGIGRFIPPQLRERVELPQRVWVGDRPELPGNDEVPPGEYFLKANHGSGFQREIRYPNPPGERRDAQALAARWLASGYGESWGEWWYAPVKRRLLLERRLGEPGAGVPDWKLWVIGGRVRAMHVIRDRFTSVSAVHYTREFELLQATKSNHAAGDPIERPAQFDAMVDAAEAIGRAFCFARVDFYLPDARRIVLGEITLCPDNALCVYTPLEFDFWLGAPWDVDALPVATPPAC